MKLDIACGIDKKQGFKGVDVVKLPGVDYVVDINKKLPFKTNSIEEIHSRHTLQHIKDVVFTLEEFYRILKIGGKLEVIVPHFTHNRAYNFFHKHHFSLHTFDWTDPTTEICQRRNYYNKIRFIVKSRYIELRKNKFFPIGYLLERIINHSPRLQHIYESNFSFIFPALNLRFIMTKVPQDFKSNYVITSSYKKLERSKFKDQKIYQSS